MARWRRWWVRARQQLDGVRHDGVMWRRFAYGGAAYFPEWFRRWTPPWVGAAVYLVMAPKRRAVMANQARLLRLRRGSWAARRASLKVFTEFAQCLTDALEMSGKPDRAFTRSYRHVERFEEVHARGRGVILVTAHTGSWEVGGRLLKLTRDIRTTMVMAREANHGARAYVDELRRRSGVDVVYASGSDPTTALTLLSRLRANEVVAIQIDRPPPNEKVVETEFCGTRWFVPEGPFRLAQASGAAVIPVFLRRTGYRAYEFTLAEPIDVPRARDPEVLRGAAQQAVTALEAFVRAYPDQWFHFAQIPDA